MLPKSLIGIIGLMLFIGYFAGFIPNSDPDIPKINRDQLAGSMNDSGSTIDQLFAAGGMMIDTVQIVLLLSTFQIDGIPAEMSIFFLLLDISLIMGILITIVRGGFNL